MKKAYLVTFTQTVRIIAEELPEDTDSNLQATHQSSIIEDAFIKAQEVMSINGAFDSFYQMNEDTECLIGTVDGDYYSPKTL